MIIKSAIKDYEVEFVTDKKYFDDLVKIPDSLFVVDANLIQYHENLLNKIPVNRRIFLPISEEKKTLVIVQMIYDFFMKLSARKNATIISIGGGILQDVTGFAASTIYRGINWVYIPTTLLAQADSCIGSKTSLNYNKYKNLIGSFFTPSKIYIDPSFVTTLNQKDYLSGIGEIAKINLMSTQKDIDNYIKDIPSLIERNDPKVLLRNIKRSLELKQVYIEMDEFDRSTRNLLNYGHCFGHAIESATGFEIPHGQAVVLGMIIANQISASRGKLSYMRENFIFKNCLLPILDEDVKKVHIEADAVIHALKQDKKRTTNDLPLVIMTANGFVRVQDMKEVEVMVGLKYIQRLL